MSLLFGNDEFFTEQVQRHSAAGSNSYVHVLLHSTNGDAAEEKGAVECREPFQLTERMWICRLPKALRDIVYRSCESPGVPYQEAFRQYGQLYTIALFTGPWMPGQVSSWDAPGEITRFITFSQLVHPTSIGFGNSVRFTFSSSAEFIEADPGPCRGITEQAFTIPHHRNWLSKSECEQVRSLLANSRIDKLPQRVARARWNVQHAAYQYFFEVRALLVVSGLEALLHTRGQNRRRPGTGKQFKTRTRQLADLLDVPFTSDAADVVWDHRSDVVHGRDPWASRRNGREQLQQPPDLTKDDETVRSYLHAEQLLRATVLRCLTDLQFSALFTSDESVEKSFPIT
jgi:hypothetical protein